MSKKKQNLKETPQARKLRLEATQCGAAISSKTFSKASSPKSPQIDRKNWKAKNGI